MKTTHGLFVSSVNRQCEQCNLKPLAFRKTKSCLKQRLFWNSNEEGPKMRQS